MKGKKLPKWFWPVGIGVAILLGLYLRNRSKQSQQSSSQQQTNTPTDITSSPYQYTGSGAYPSNAPYYDYYGASPYGASSYGSSLGLPSGFDPTSFEEGISYAQGNLGIPNLTSTPTDSVGTAPTPTPVSNSGGTPATINLNIAPSYGQRTGRPKVSGRRTAARTHKKKVRQHA